MANSDQDLSTAETAERILDLLRSQASMYVRLETLAVRQRTLVSVEDAGPLLGLLASRQKLSDGLTLLSKQLEPVRRSWETLRDRLSEPDRVEADRLWSDARESLSRIIERDEQDARILSARKELVRETLCATHSKGQAISAYAAPAGKASRLDRLDGDA